MASLSSPPFVYRPEEHVPMLMLCNRRLSYYVTRTEINGVLKKNLVHWFVCVNFGFSHVNGGGVRGRSLLSGEWEVWMDLGEDETMRCDCENVRVSWEFLSVGNEMFRVNWDLNQIEIRYRVAVMFYSLIENFKCIGGRKAGQNGVLQTNFNQQPLQL